MTREEWYEVWRAARIIWPLGARARELLVIGAHERYGYRCANMLRVREYVSGTRQRRNRLAHYWIGTGRMLTLKQMRDAKKRSRTLAYHAQKDLK